MISRVADSCFWLGRYIERIEATARLLSVTRNLAMDAELEPRECWLPVVIVIGEEPQFVQMTTEMAIPVTSGEQVERYMTWDEDNMSSIRQSVSAARENARQIREVISLEVWETVNELYLWMGSTDARTEYANERHAFYRYVLQRCQLMAGLLRSTMLHELPLNFVWLGMLMERAGQTARVVDVQHHALMSYERENQVIETALWLSLLRACSAFEPFTKRNRGRITGDAVANFLIFEPLFPKSIAYSVHEAFCRFLVIRPPEETTLPGEATQERLRALDGWIASHAENGVDGNVHGVLTHVVDEVAEICSGLGHELFGHRSEAELESAQ